MANALAKIQKGANKARNKLAAKGFREVAVTLRLSAAAAGTENTDLGIVGDGVPDDLPLTDPVPKVENVSLRSIELSSGVIQMGDLKISGITRLDPAVDARLKDPACVFVIEGLNLDGEYSLVGAGNLTTRNTEHVAIVRRTPDREGA